MDNEMPCFNPEDVIFITNKWDSLNINDNGEDSSDDDEETKVWENIKENLKERWPSLREENIFRMNLKDVNLAIFNRCLPDCLKSLESMKLLCVPSYCNNDFLFK